MRVACVIGGVVALLSSAPAHAATVFAYSDSISYRADAGEANDLSVSIENGTVVLTDPGAQIQSEQCSTSADRHRASCSLAGFVAFSVALQDGDDRATGPTGLRSMLLQGGPGDDSLTGSGEENTLDGGEGNDVLNGDSSHPQGPDCQYMEINDRMDGGPGDDTLNGGAGADQLRGGPGNDTVDGGADCDVVAGDELEHWDTPDTSYEGAGGDRVLGGAGGDKLYAGPGDDLVDGGDGVDELHAGLGSDSIAGGEDKDQAGYHRRGAPVVASLAGGPGNGEPGENDTIAADVEVLHGGAGNDRLTGNSGVNTLVGHGGDDVLDAAGARGDTVAAGSGSDLVIAYDGDKALDGPQYTPTVSTGPPFPGDMWAGRDDFITCDDLPGLEPGHDTALIDPEDTPAGNTGADMGCETILFGPPRTTVAPGQSTVTVPATCTDLQTACSGAVSVRTLTRRGALAPKPTWKSLGRRAFRRNGKRGRKVSVKLSRRAARSLTRQGRARVYVAYEYKRARRSR